MKKYGHITIMDSGVESDNHPVYMVVNNKSKSIIATIEYYPQWKQYILSPDAQAVFNNSCLRDILDYMENIVSLREVQE